MSQSAPPVLFVAFANPDNPSGDAGLARLQLGQEAHNIYAALAPGEEQGGWQFLNGAETTRANLIDSFTTNRIVLFHYGGHSNSRGLWLPAESPENRLVDGDSLDRFLASQHSLQLVFFNSCENNAWAQKLFASVPYVVATVTPVPDQAAVTFSNTFYRALSQEQNTVENAFEIASNAVKLAYAGLFSDPTQQNGAPSAPTRSTDELTDEVPAASSVFPWILYKNPSVQPWRLADSAADPLVGMPPLPPHYYTSLPDKPYVAIKGHTKDDAALFFGRNDEIRSLYDWVLSPHTTQPILLFYGQSGAGKSSLLNAGLLPRLGESSADENHPNENFPVAYRRRNLDLIDDLHAAIAEVLIAAGVKVTPPANPDLAWWNSLAQQWLALTTPSLVILDQLEEAITHFIKPNNGDETARYKTPLDEIGAFVARVREIFAARLANSPARLLLSFRKEYLAEIRGRFANGEADDSPELVEHFWLDRLNDKAIAQIITGPSSSRLTRDKYKISFPEGDELPAHISGELLKGDSPIATVLEIILNQMWEHAKLDGNGARIYDFALFNGLAGRDNPLQGFYDQQTAALDDRHNTSKDIPDVSQGLELDLLFEHTSEYGTSVPVSLDTLRGKYPDTLDIPKLLDANKDLYLLVEPATEPGGSKTAPDTTGTADTTALAHDTLAHIVRHNFLHSSLPGPRARRILEGRVREWQDSKKGALLDGVDLKTVSRGLPHMRKPTVDEEKLLAASRTYRRRAMLRSFALMLVLPVLLIGTLATVIYQLRQKELTAINNAEANLNSNNSQVLAIAEALEAVRIQQKYGSLLRLDLTHNNAAVNKAILNNLHKALAQREIYRAEITTQALFLGDCTTALDAKNHPLLTTRGGKLYLGGTEIPDDLTSVSITACDAASQTIVWLRNTPGLPEGVFRPQPGVFVWRKGKTQTIPLPILAQGRIAPNYFALNPGGTVLAFGINTDSKFDRYDLYLLELNTSQFTQVPGRMAVSGQRFSLSGRYLIQPGINAIDLSSPAFAASSMPAESEGLSTSQLDGQDAVTAVGANLLKVYRVADGAHFDYLPADPGDVDQNVYFKDKHIFDAAIAPSGKIMASDSTGNRIDLWAVPSSLEPLPAGWDSVDKKLVNRLRRESNITSFPLHLGKFNIGGTPDDRHAFSPDSQLLVTVEFPPINDSPYPHAENTTAYLHMWKVEPYTPEELKQINLPVPLFDKGCDLIGNFIDDMADDITATKTAMVSGTENIDYPALSKACKARKRQQTAMEKAKVQDTKDDAKTGRRKPDANPSNRRPDANGSARRPGLRDARPGR